MKPNDFPRLTFELSLPLHDALPGSNRLFLSFGGQSLRIQCPWRNDSAAQGIVK
jgi:hypothetical protein